LRGPLGFLPKYTCGELVKYRSLRAFEQRSKKGVDTGPKEGVEKGGLKRGSGIRSGVPDSRGFEG
jgi:hypothetical protein